MPRDRPDANFHEYLSLLLSFATDYAAILSNPTMLPNNFAFPSELNLSKKSGIQVRRPSPTFLRMIQS